MHRLERHNRSALDWLRERRDKSGAALISQAEYDAGDRLRRDFARAMMQPRVTSAWSPTPVRHNRGAPPAAAAFHEHTTAARQRVRTALADVGPDYANILIDVCCLDLKLQDVERDAGWPQRSGKVVLQLALRQLARHYGLLRDAGPDAAAVRIRHWGDAGNRPELDTHACDASSGNSAGLRHTVPDNG